MTFTEMTCSVLGLIHVVSLADVIRNYEQSFPTQRRAYVVTFYVCSLYIEILVKTIKGFLNESAEWFTKVI